MNSTAAMLSQSAARWKGVDGMMSFIVALELLLLAVLGFWLTRRRVKQYCKPCHGYGYAYYADARYRKCHVCGGKEVRKPW